jgi:DNA-directed RNA polymerase subunit RPC12/RpoP
MLRKCSICEREFAASHELNRHYTTVCPECRAIDKPKKEIAQIGELCVLIEKVWREYQNLQDQYRKLTGKEYMWLR